MQRVTFVRYTAKPDRAEENEALSRAVFTELHAAKPSGVAYALFRSGNEFVHLFVNLEEDSSDILTERPVFKAFSAGGPERWEAPPEVIRLATDMIASYGFEGALAPA
jgi:hypothetical protein